MTRLLSWQTIEPENGRTVGQQEQSTTTTSHRPRGVGASETQLASPHNGLRPRVNIKLAVQVAGVCTDRVGGHDQLGRDLRHGQVGRAGTAGYAELAF